MLSTCRSKARVVVDDNCCLCHVAGVKYMSQLSDDDVLHASFKNNVFEVSKYSFRLHLKRILIKSYRSTAPLLPSRRSRDQEHCAHHPWQSVHAWHVHRSNSRSRTIRGTWPSGWHNRPSRHDCRCRTTPKAPARRQHPRSGLRHLPGLLTGRDRPQSGRRSQHSAGRQIAATLLRPPRLRIRHTSRTP